MEQPPPIPRRNVEKNSGKASRPSLPRLKHFLPWLAVGAFLVFLLISVFFRWPILQGCVLYQETGIHCPGCGMTRATWALMEFDFLKALSLHPLAMLGGPLVAILIVWKMLWLRKRNRLHWAELLSFPSWQLKLIFVLVLCWFVARNIPHSSFEWARPTPDTIFDHDIPED